MARAEGAPLSMPTSSSVSRSMSPRGGGPPLARRSMATKSAVPMAMAAPSFSSFSSPVPCPPPSAPSPITTTTTAPSTPAAQPTQASQQQHPKEASGTVTLTVEVDHEDYTKLPGQLDSKFEAIDDDSALRSTILKADETWTKHFQKALLAAPTKTTLYTKDLEEEKKKAYDLLDCLSRSGKFPFLLTFLNRSGCLCFDHASLHIVLAATHCFDKTITNTLVQDNMNPIEKMERSMLIIATTIHQKPASELLKPEVLEKVRMFSPLVFKGVPGLLEGSDVKLNQILDKGKDKEKV